MTTPTININSPYERARDTMDELLANVEFAMFYVGLRGLTQTDEPTEITITASETFADYEECNLKLGGKEVSFLLTNPDEGLELHQRMGLRLEYFKKAYLAGIDLDARVYQEEYGIAYISLLDPNTHEYEIRLTFERGEKTPLCDYLSGLETQAQKGGMLGLWIGVNSLYKQLVDIRTGSLKPVARNSIALDYLKIVQRTVAINGITHHPLDIVPATGEIYPLRGTEFRVTDPRLKGRTVHPLMRTSDVREAVFFDPDIYPSIIKNEVGNPYQLTITVNAKNLLDLIVE